MNPQSTRATNDSSDKPASPTEKLAFSKTELAASLGLSQVTLWRLEKRGLLKSVVGIRNKRYARAEVERFLEGRR
jgi:hypothetical protein